MTDEPTLKDKALILLYLMQEGTPPAWQGPQAQVKALSYLTGAPETECEKAFVENADAGFAEIKV
jgi:hypothetical protein